MCMDWPHTHFFQIDLHYMRSHEDVKKIPKIGIRSRTETMKEGWEIRKKIVITTMNLQIEKFYQNAPPAAKRWVPRNISMMGENPDHKEKTLRAAK